MDEPSHQPTSGHSRSIGGGSNTSAGSNKLPWAKTDSGTSGSTAAVRQTSFSKRANHMGVEAPSKIKMPSPRTGAVFNGGSIVRSTAASRKFYEYSSDEQDVLQNGHMDAYSEVLRRKVGPLTQGRIASSGGSDKSSSSETDLQPRQQLTARKGSSLRYMYIAM